MKLYWMLFWPYYRIKEEIEFRKKLKELQQSDPYIYK